MMQFETKGRILSIDTLRGFDMFFITGGAVLVSGLCTALGFGEDCWLAVQMRHAEWVGFTQHDTIFPLFLFLSGATRPFSLAAQMAKGRSRWQICRKIAVRSVILFLLGLSLGGILRFKPDFRLMRHLRNQLNPQLPPGRKKRHLLIMRKT